jgi:hypothetical protein
MQTEAQKPKFSAKEVAEEVFQLTGHRYDPAYISNIRSGARHVKALAPVIEQAESNLEARSKAA